MDKGLMIKRFSKAVESYDSDATAQHRIALKMIRLLRQFLKNDVSHAIEIGCGTGIFSRLLVDAFQPTKFVINDICDEMKSCCQDLLAAENYSFSSCDAELWDLPANVDLIASCSAFQWFQDPKKFFRKAHSSLNRNGCFAFSTFGKSNLHEVSTITGKSLSYFSMEQLTEMISQTGFSMLHAEEEKIVLSFDTPMDVLYHIKKTGVNGISSQKWTKKSLREFTDQYSLSHSSIDRKVTLTYHPIYLICKKS